MNRICYLSRNYKRTTSAGGKAKTDNEDTLRELGAVNIGLSRSSSQNSVVAFARNLLGVVRACLLMRRGDLVLLQYPVKKYFAFLCRAARLRGARTVAVIHDLGSFRRKKLTVEQEVNRLMQADYVVASNEVMAEWLRLQGFSKPLGALGFFDYRSPARNVHSGELTYGQRLPKLVFAGALGLRKNAFLLELQDRIAGYEMAVYGNRSGLPGLSDREHFAVHDFLPADDFIGHVEADFGLLWDGDSCDECSGSFGDYLRYNSPHRASFYLRACLPVVVWRDAAIAGLIEREGLGVCVTSLSEIPAALSAITPEQYARMKANVRRWADRLDRGESLRTALSAVSLALFPASTSSAPNRPRP